MKKNLVFYGHHKCGSRYIRRHLLKRIAAIAVVDLHQYRIANPVFEFNKLEDLDLKNVDFERLSGAKCILGLTNSSPAVVREVFRNDGDHVGLHVVRDPRQVLVSCYYHHLKGHPAETAEWRWPKLAQVRSKLKNLSLEDGLMYEMDSIAGEVLDQQLRAWRPHDKIIEVRLEEIDSLLPDLTGFLGNQLDVDISGISADKSRKFENPHAQNWRKVFTPRIRQEFGSRFGDLISKYGYTDE